MLIYGIAAYLVITFVFTLFGINKQAEAVKLFIISIIFTPVAGLIWIFKNKPQSKKINYYYCNECDYIYPIKMGHCPICAENGKKVRLKKYKSPYDLSKNLQKLSLT